jgi:hypothetical protein
VQIARQGSWTLAEPPIINARWLIQLWLAAGAGIRLLLGIAVIILYRIEPTPPATSHDVIFSQPVEFKFRPREG